MISPVSCLSSRRSQGTFPTTPPFHDIAKRRRRPIGVGETWENTEPAGELEEVELETKKCINWVQ